MKVPGKQNLDGYLGEFPPASHLQMTTHHLYKLYDSIRRRMDSTTARVEGPSEKIPQYTGWKGRDRIF